MEVTSHRTTVGGQSDITGDSLFSSNTCTQGRKRRVRQRYDSNDENKIWFPRKRHLHLFSPLVIHVYRKNTTTQF